MRSSIVVEVPEVCLRCYPIPPVCFPLLRVDLWRVIPGKAERSTVLVKGEDVCRHAHGMCRSLTGKIRVVSRIPLFSQGKKTRCDKTSLISVFYPWSWASAGKFATCPTLP